MVKRSKAYWAERALAREASYQAGSVRTMAELNRAYDQAGANILRRLDSIERNAAKRSADEQSPYIYRRQLAEAAKAAVEREFEQLRETEIELTAARYAEVMNDAYYKSLFDMQKGTGLGFSFAKLHTGSVEATLNEGWLGRDFSKSVWRNTGVLVQRVQEVVQGGLLSGASIDTMAAQLAAAKLEINDTLREGKFAAYRLIRTETNYFANQGELMSCAEAGIVYYDYLATLDGHTSKICQKLDGVVFRVADAEVCSNYPPMHPYCRSTTVAHFDDKNLDELQRRACNPVTGKTQLVPASMNYQEWYDTYVKDSKEAERSLKAAKNASRDKRQFEKYADILGKNAPKTFADFQKMKYNDSREWEALKRNVKLFAKIDDTEGYSAEYKAKLKETYNYFKDNGYEFREHGLNRAVGQKKSKNKREFSKEELLDVLRKEPNFIEDGAKLVRYYDGIAAIQAKDTGEIISVVARPSPSENWKEV